ncbi:hypothetical protein [Hydrogenophaga sp.]|uniref:hypothetical protein n=1 Tax=Hydrogenophaga sp. TaxID=1904254 RepID=UPI0025B7FE01|nr:hypothetical protein [Hydrogenophaga sp.]
MTYSLKLFVPEGSAPAKREAAERLFRQSLAASLGDSTLVAPVYTAYLVIVGQHGETPDPEALTVEERTVLEHWQQAEGAALAAVFGPHRNLDEGGYEIRLDP